MGPAGSIIVTTLKPSLQMTTSNQNMEPAARPGNVNTTAGDQAALRGHPRPPHPLGQDDFTRR